MSVNKVFLKGRLGSDPENKNGAVRFSLATSERWTDESGNKQEKTQWHNVVAFKKLGEIFEKYLQKGQEVFIEGQIEYREHEGKYYTSIIAKDFDFVSRPNNQNNNSQEQNKGIVNDEFPY